MFVAHVQLLGSDIEDAFIYRTVLYCWTYRKTLRIYQVADLESALALQDRSQEAPGQAPRVAADCHATCWLRHRGRRRTRPLEAETTDCARGSR